MNKPLLHTRACQMVDTAVGQNFSLEITAKDIEALIAVAPRIPPGTSIAITHLPGESLDSRVAAARAVRQAGFEPMPHFAARRFATTHEFERFLEHLNAEASVKHFFVIAGDPAEPEGPFADAMDLIRTGAFERAGATMLGIAGHPEGTPHMTPIQCRSILVDKCSEIEARGMEPLIVTQFAFDSDPLIDWLRDLRAKGIYAPVRLGIPGPAGVKTLVRFAVRCGVGASTAVLAKYGISLSRLIGTAGPEKLVQALDFRLTPDLGPTSLHLYPFGGLERTVEWMSSHAARDYP